jgi:2'-5' RNA ligase
VAQSVELIFDPATENALRVEWDRLADAGLPSCRRSQPDPDNRPHLTLYAAETISAEADERLPALFAGLELSLRIGGLMIFGPRHGQVILVRLVVPSTELLVLQSRTARLCGADALGQFGAGGWTPHITLARRMGVDQLGVAINVLGGSGAELAGVVRHCRRWDGQRRTVRWLSTPG